MGKKIVRLTESDLTRIVKKVIEENKFNSSNINEYFGGSDETFNHKLENLNLDAVLDGLNALRRYRPEDYEKFFGRIIKSRGEYKRDTSGQSWLNYFK
jgi:uncharacterized protein YehS (DUF1456 family)